MNYYSLEQKEEALKRKDLSSLTNMIEDNVDINSLVIPHHTDVLLAAINKRNKNFFRYVLEKGFNCKSGHNFLYIHHAIRTHELFFVKELLSHYKKIGLSYNEYSKEKDNNLHVAVAEGSSCDDIIELLTVEGIRWDEQNIQGQTPLHILLRTEESISDKIIKIIKKQKKIFNVEDNFSISPLDIIESAKNDDFWRSENEELIRMIEEI